MQPFCFLSRSALIFISLPSVLWSAGAWERVLGEVSSKAINGASGTLLDRQHYSICETTPSLKRRGHIAECAVQGTTYLTLPPASAEPLYPSPLHCFRSGPFTRTSHSLRLACTGEEALCQAFRHGYNLPPLLALDSTVAIAHAPLDDKSLPPRIVSSPANQPACAEDLVALAPSPCATTPETKKNTFRSTCSFRTCLSFPSTPLLAVRP